MYADDAEFIAHARLDVPVLLAEVDRLRKALTDLLSLAERYEADIDCEWGSDGSMAPEIIAARATLNTNGAQ